MSTETPKGAGLIMAICWVVMLAGTVVAFAVGQVVAGIACVLLTAAAGAQWWAVRVENRRRLGRMFGEDQT